ncbi:MAG: ATP-grasp domain-containing protein [Fibrobacterales bacterium]
MHILVTGVSGDLGQAIVKCLRHMHKDVFIIGCDAVAQSIGAVFVDAFYAIPYVNDPRYWEEVKNLLQRYSCQAIIPGSDTEIQHMAKAVLNNTFNCKCPVISLSARDIELFGDKLLCYDTLKDNIPLVSYVDGLNLSQVHNFIKKNSFPFIVKERLSCGSKSLKIAHTEEELFKFLKSSDKPLIQEFIPGDANEYTIGAYADNDTVEAIIFQRDLGPSGCSWYAQTVTDDEILQYCLDIVKVSKIQGAFNIQVKKTEKGVFLLEINARFSSLVAARALCGFCDLEWSLKKALSIPYTIPTHYTPIRFQRFFGEVVDYGSGYTGVKNWNPQTHD